MIADRVEQVQTRVDRLVRASVEKITPVGGMQEELELLRDRLAELEQSLARTGGRVAGAHAAAQAGHGDSISAVVMRFSIP